MRISTRKERNVSQFIGDASGTTLFEYALLAAFASVVVIIALLAIFNTRT